MVKFIDLLVTDSDLTLDVAANPLLIDGRDSIAQDIKHMIIENGYLVDLVAERNPERVALTLLRIARKIDLDARMVPGTAQVSRVDAASIYVTAQTVDYGILNNLAVTL